MTTLFPPEASRWPKYRLVGLVLVHLFGIASFVIRVGLPSEQVRYSLVGLFFGPSLYMLVLIAAIAWQVYMIVKPPHEQPRTMCFYDNHNEFTEFLLIGVGLMFACIPFDVIPYVQSLIPIGFVVAGRRNTTIDGQARRVLVFGWFPRVIPFDELSGVGPLDVKVIRAGKEVGTRHEVAVFLKNGVPVRVRDVGAAARQDIIARVAATTGLPAALR